MRRVSNALVLLVAISFVFVLIVRCGGPAVAVKQPPPAKTEVRPARPFPDAVWIGGHWKWNAGRYVWVTGRWAKPQPGRRWIEGHWKKVPGGWTWIKGHWR